MVGSGSIPPISQDAAAHFRNELRAARALVLGNAEGFDEILFVVERMGIHLTGSVSNLGAYEGKIAEIAELSPLASDLPNKPGALFADFRRLYNIVKDARNDALHVGAYARHVTNCSIELAIILEDALMSNAQLVRDFMVRSPILASGWQALGLIRQTMLANSFTYLPITLHEGRWQLLSDYTLGKFLRLAPSTADRRRRLALPLAEAVDGGHLDLDTAPTCAPDDGIETALACSRGKPVLVLDKQSQEVVGIVTPFDLL